jgi:hypothetical protein
MERLCWWCGEMEEHGFFMELGKWQVDDRENGGHHAMCAWTRAGEEAPIREAGKLHIQYHAYVTVYSNLCLIHL